MGGGTSCLVLCVGRDGSVGGVGVVEVVWWVGWGEGVAMDCRGVDCMCVTLLEVYT